MMFGFPALPIPTIRPARTPISALTMPINGSMTTALVITRSSAPLALVASADCAMPSRIDFPPPKTASSPGTVRSRSTSQMRFVSASRNRSPAVGPYSSA